jgi:putative ABC transport system permease protein
MFGNLLRDLHYSFRTLKNSPGFATVAVLTLALGIGANTAVFSVVSGVLLSPLPFKDSNRLVTWWFSSPPTLPEFALTQGHFAFYRDHSKLLDHTSAYTSAAGFNFSGAGEPERIQGANVTINFFRALGVEPILGRTFTPEEETPGRNVVCVLSHGFWKRRFGGDPQIIGKSLNLNDFPTEVVGVMPPGFDFPHDTAVWIPIGLNPKSTGFFYLRPIGMLKPGVSYQQAQAELTSILESFARERPDLYPKGVKEHVVSMPLKDAIVGSVRKPLLILLGSVAFLLLIACANVANLLLARSAKRSKEVALRFALGASTREVIFQLLTESLVLALLGAVAGVILAVFGVGLVSKLPVAQIPRINEAQLDLGVLAFTVGVAALTGFLFGLAPAFAASRVALSESLKEGTRTGLSPFSRRVNHFLVVLQTAVSVILLIGTVLLFRSAQNLLSVDAGFRYENVMTLRMSLPSKRYQKPEDSELFYRQLLDRVSVLPSVKTAGLINIRPLSGRAAESFYTVEGADMFDERQTGLAGYRITTPRYFEAMGITMLQGESFNQIHQRTSPLVAIVDDTLARKNWPNETAIGKRIRRGRAADTNNPWMTIIGVVATVKDESLGEDPVAHIYTPYTQAQGGARDMALVIQQAARSEVGLQTLQSAVWGLDPQLPLYQVQTMEKAVSDSMSTRLLTNRLLASFAAIALALAAVGIYGVMSLHVGSRIREFGIRIALGAQTRDVFRLVINRALVLSGIGVILGLAASQSLSRLIGSELFGIRTSDALTLVVTAIAVVLITLLACLSPARRATLADPVEALRAE